MPAHGTPPSLCPYCGNLLDAANNIYARRAPCGGDWTVCLHCTKVLIFCDDLTVRKPKPRELQTDYSDPKVKREMAVAIMAVRTMDRRHLNRHARRTQKHLHH